MAGGGPVMAYHEGDGVLGLFAFRLARSLLGNLPFRI